MNTSFSKKLAVLAGLELLLAATVLLGAFLLVSRIKALSMTNQRTR